MTTKGRLNLIAFQWPSQGWGALACILVIALAAGLGGARLAPPALVAIGIALGLAAILTGLNRQAADEHFAAALCDEDGVGPRPLRRSLDQIAKRLDGQRRAITTATLTGLPNRDALVEAMASDIAGGAAQGVVGVLRLVDFDRLSAFDAARADTVLRQFARRLQDATRSSNLLAQIRRDCFAIWLRRDDVAAGLSEFNAIAYVAAQDIVEGEYRLTPTFEVGAAAFPEDGADADQLLRFAVSAFDGPAIAPGGKIRLAPRPSIEAARERFVLEQGLSRAIDENQLSMVFQPVIDAEASRIIGAEALLRWRHPTLGSVSPARFIPIVESMGLSDSYGQWVLNTACREARRWRDEGLEGLRIAVNLSARQLLDPDLRDKVERTLRRHGLAPACLELELTETAVMADAERTARLFRQLREMGVSLAIDDFGSGYSSFGYLKNLPFDKLKIDREFVTDIQDRRENRAICRALVQLGRGLNLTVLAEGVETADEVRTLRRIGCRIFQGFYFSRPLPGDDFVRAAKAPAWPAAPRVAADAGAAASTRQKQPVSVSS